MDKYIIPVIAGFHLSSHFSYIIQNQTSHLASKKAYWVNIFTDYFFYLYMAIKYRLNMHIFMLFWHIFKGSNIFLRRLKFILSPMSIYGMLLFLPVKKLQINLLIYYINLISYYFYIKILKYLK